MRLKHLLVIGLCLFLGGLGVAACGDSNDDNASGASDGTTTTKADSGGYGSDEDTSDKSSKDKEGYVTVSAADNTELGKKILVDGDGKSIYFFMKDTKDSGKSVCNEGCADTWPAVTVEDAEDVSGGTGAEGLTYGVITRDDGTTQVTVNGMPVYHFAAESGEGSIDGQGIGGIWWVIAPDGTPIQT
jgi:predicted lipoprotein with Yx(FWY)xxD motif